MMSTIKDNKYIWIAFWMWLSFLTPAKAASGEIVVQDIERFAETLEMHDFPFSQEAQWREHIGVIRQVDEIFIGAARFLLCCICVRAINPCGNQCLAA